MQHCSFCKREVQSTLHLKDSFRVDYFQLVFGKTKRIDTGEDKDKHTGKSWYLQVIVPKEYIVCIDCRAKPQILQLILSFPEPNQMPDA